MEKPKLNPDDLVVSTFETESDLYSPYQELTTTGPTPATRCFYCHPSMVTACDC